MQLTSMARGCSHSLSDVCELVASATEALDVDVLLYGSTVEFNALVGDLDVWIEGDADMVTEAVLRLGMLGYSYLIEVDVVSSNSDNEDFDAAIRSCVSRYGVLVQGRRPESPPIADVAVKAAYRSAIRRQARQLAHNADVLARAGVLPTVEFVEATIKAWLRSLSSDRLEERVIKRESTAALLQRVAVMDVELSQLVHDHGLTSHEVSSALADRLI